MKKVAIQRLFAQLKVLMVLFALGGCGVEFKATESPSQSEDPIVLGGGSRVGNALRLNFVFMDLYQTGSPGYRLDLCLNQISFNNLRVPNPERPTPGQANSSDSSPSGPSSSGAGLATRHRIDNSRVTATRTGASNVIDAYHYVLDRMSPFVSLDSLLTETESKLEFTAAPGCTYAPNADYSIQLRDLFTNQVIASSPEPLTFMFRGHLQLDSANGATVGLYNEFLPAVLDASVSTPNLLDALMTEAALAGQLRQLD
jgi:hypothetical protein